MEPIDNGRAKVEQWGSDFKIIIPSKSNLLTTLFLMFWLGGWLIGEVTVITILFKAPLAVNFFMVSWLGGWTIGGIAVITTVLWNLFGQEVIYTEDNCLTIANKVLFFVRKKRYDTASIANFRVDREALSRPPYYMRRHYRNFMGRGVIAFDYGLKTIRFGNALDEVEANYLVDDVISRYI